MNDRVRTHGVDDLSITSVCNVIVLKFDVLKCCRYSGEDADESRSDLTEATIRQSCGGCEIKKLETLWLVAMVQTGTRI